jgi:hypothetical protein
VRLFAAAGLVVGLLFVQDSASKELKGLQERLEKSDKKGLERYTEFKALFEAFAAKHAGTEEALTAKLWVLQNVGWLREKGRAEATRLAEEIVAEYPKSKQIGKISEWPFLFTAKKLEGYLEKMFENSPHDEVKGAALLGLARLARRNGTAGREKAAEMLKTVKEKYGDIPFRFTTCGRMADALLNPYKPEDLEVGKKAPELEGMLVDGKKIKLSDLKGKVVVLDFWGDW